MKRSILWGFLLGCCTLIWGIGCAEAKGESGKKEDYTIGVVTKSQGSEYWLSVCAGMRKAAEEFQVELVILSPDTERDKITQKQMIEDLIKLNVDALAVSSIDSNDNRDYIELARKKGIEVFSYDTPIEDEKIPYIGIDNQKAGYELAKETARMMDHKGEIAVISGDIGQACHGQRVKGFMEYMSEQENIKIDFVKTGYSNLQVSQEETEELLRQYPHLDGIMTTSAVTALGLAEATENKKILIVSFDAQEDAIASVKKGGISALVNQSGTEIGYETIRYIVNDKEGMKQDYQKILEIEVLTKENIE